MTGQKKESLHSFRHYPILLFLLVLATTVPLLFPAIPPLIDLPGHMSRYHIERDLAASPALQLYYDFHWALTGNLGVDLLIVPMATLFGLELGTKLIVIAIPAMLAAGFLGVARELHGRVPPTALFALPLAYHYAFQYGFVNFSLSAALCFLAFWLWLRLGRVGRIKLRALLFLPLACLIWLSHIYGWGMLGVLVFAAQAVERRQSGASWPNAVLRGAIDCAPLALPFLLMLVWRSGSVDNGTGGWFNWSNKVEWLISILRERWMEWDMASAILLLALALFGLLGRGMTIEPRARLAAILLFLLFLIIPRVLIGSGYADMRLAAFVVAVAILGLAPGKGWSPAFSRLVTVAAVLFVIARLAVTTAAYAQMHRSWQAQLAAIDHIEEGRRVLVLASLRCRAWAYDRMAHVSSIAVVRKNVYTNAQWAIAGAQLLTVKYQKGAPFVIDPSHLMRRPPCPDQQRLIPLALSKAQGAFDYLWLVDLPRADWPATPGLVPVWQGEGGRGLLLRVPSGTPTGG